MENSTFRNKLNFFSSGSIFFSFFARTLKVTIFDGCISLNSVQHFLVVLGVVDMCHLLLNEQINDRQNMFQNSILFTNSPKHVKCRFHHSMKFHSLEDQNQPLSKSYKILRSNFQKFSQIFAHIFI